MVKMSERKSAKKSETLEVRVEHEVKTALMQRAQAEGRSASDVIRECIHAYLAEQSKEARSMFGMISKPAAAVGAVSIAMVWAVGSIPASAAPDLRAEFEALDGNGDKVVTAQEFIAGSRDRMFIVKADVPAPPPVAGGAKPFVLPMAAKIPAPPPEASAPPEAMVRSEFMRLDRNGDGNVSFEEFRDHHAALMRAGFVTLDTNGDGAIDAAEFQSGLRHAPQSGAGAAPFAQMDADGNGRITQEEFFG